MPWSFTSDKPIYLQIVERIERRIISGEYLPGDRLPTVREFASEAAVNPNTMQRALAELEEIGLVCTQRNVGRSVTEEISVIETAKIRAARELVGNYTEKMAALGYSTDAALEFLVKYKEENNT